MGVYRARLPKRLWGLSFLPLPASGGSRPSWTSGCRLLCLGKNTGVGCHALLQGLFLTQGSNPHLLCLPAPAGGFFTTSTTFCQLILTEAYSGNLVNFPYSCLKF